MKIKLTRVLKTKRSKSVPKILEISLLQELIMQSVKRVGGLA